MNNGEIIQVGNLFPDTDSFKNRTAGRVYSIEGLSPTIRTPSGGGIIPQIIVDMKTQKTNTEVQQDSMVAEPMIVQKFGDRGTNQYSVRDIAHTIPANPMSDRGQMLLEPSVQKDSMVAEPQAVSYTRDSKGRTVNKHLNPIVNTIHQSTGGGGNTDCFIAEPKYRIRKLTPRECFRLMGVDDADIDTLQSAGISNSQQYKLAGNSIVVDVLYHIFRKMFVEVENENNQLTLF